ncbi:MAG: hypothetical protein JXM70_04370 [Pirellulales bacterium]|nr:hypothetical protein [Pirellulales bacterium]
MKACDLNTPTGRLRQAFKDLQVARTQIADKWQDETHRKFEEEFLVDLETSVRRTVAAIGEFAEILGKAQRDCEGY